MSSSNRSLTPTEQHSRTPKYKTPRKLRMRTPSLKAVETVSGESDDGSRPETPLSKDSSRRRYARKISPSKKYPSNEYNIYPLRNRGLSRETIIEETAESKNKGGIMEIATSNNYSSELVKEAFSTQNDGEGLLGTPLSKQRKCRRSTRKTSPSKKYRDDEYSLPLGTPSNSRKGVSNEIGKLPSKSNEKVNENEEMETLNDNELELLKNIKPSSLDIEMLGENNILGRNIFDFHTPKKRVSMTLAAMNTPKTPKTSKTPKSLTGKTPDAKRKTLANLNTKTPSHIRHRVKNQISKLVDDNSESDFSTDESEFIPSDNESSSSSQSSSTEEMCIDGDQVNVKELKTPKKVRPTINIPILPKTPSATASRVTSTRRKNTNYVDFIPESDAYFQSRASSRIQTSDHTLDRLKNPRLPADRLFSLLANMKLTDEHQQSISLMSEEYKSYFGKWLILLSEGFNILLYGLGSKRNLLQSFHREVLQEQTVLVVNGFFPSLTIKDILDSITNEILDIKISAANPHEAVDIIEQELELISETHLYLIVHNIDGTMLRNMKAQSILARLAKISNIHLLASIDHINTPLLWDQTILINFNFCWWDCTTMLPYSDETAFENSLLVQNSGELALSALRNVFLSLTTNSRGVFMIIVKHQLQNRNNSNYQGMIFKDLYWSCREAFLVSSDLALRAQLTEFLDHKLVKSKRGIDGSELLRIPIDPGLLQQFLEEQQSQEK